MTSIASTFRPPPQHMVQTVRNIVRAYKMGPIRALAQDPVQNSFDARRSGAAGPVTVEYHLLQRNLESGEAIHLLTVTDQNTTGLCGPALSVEDLEERGYLLSPEENWAAWEAMGFTKVGEDSLGSRGQGKAAFLYHSRHPSEQLGPGNLPLERMIILYDSLLEDGTYRFGVRLAQPADLVRYPPYEGAQAREIVSTVFREWQGPAIPLGLEPLTDVGTRIIVPFLSYEAVEAIRDGTLVRWLERCWWRAVQTGSLRINIVSDTGEVAEIGIPDWWSDEPWTKIPRLTGVFVKNNFALQRGSELKIKRVVLLYDPDLRSNDIPDAPAQYLGVQLLRGTQWIETLGTSERFGDYIPPDKRAGFRGFVEFDRQLEYELREVESPQHDTFDRRRTSVKQIDAHIGDAVKRFAEQQGWAPRGGSSQTADKTAEEVLREVVNVFLSEGGPGVGPQPPSIVWDCELDADFPHPETSRIEWGEELRNIEVSCSHVPADRRRDVAISLCLVSPEGDETEIGSKDRRTDAGATVADFGNVTIVRVSRRQREVACPQPGKYRLRAKCVSEGQVVACATRNLYVRTDPPSVPPRPFAVGITVRNTTADRVRVNNGDAVSIAVTITNRTPNSAQLFVNASLEELLLADEVGVTIPGRPQGDTPSFKMLSYSNVHVFTEAPNPKPAGLFVILPPGRHFVRTDIKDSGGNSVAHASKVVFVETDPEKGGGGMPFETRAHERTDIPFPVWQLEPPIGEGALYVLRWAKHHPTFLAACAADDHHRNGPRLYGTKHFWAETYCSALVEWALILYRESGDTGGFTLVSDRPLSTDQTLWERYQFKVDELMDSYADPLKCLTLQREVSSIMLYILQRGSA